MKLWRKKSSPNTGRRRRSSAAPERFRQPQQQQPVVAPATASRNRIVDEPSSRKSEQRSAAVKNAGASLVQRFGHLVLLTAIVASAVNILTLSTSPKILPLSTTSDTTFLHSQATYQQAANELLASSFWNRNKITINSGQISKQMLAQFPELSTASVTLPLLAHRPIVYIEASQPALILATSSGSFVLDDQGKALLLSNQLPADKHLSVPVVTDQSGLSVTLNHEALSSSYVSFIQTVVAQLNAKHLAFATLTLPSEANELDVWLVGQPYFVKFNLQQSGDARQQVGTFLAVLSQLQGQGITPAHYVDVRVDGRAYYQ